MTIGFYRRAQQTGGSTFAWRKADLFSIPSAIHRGAFHPYKTRTSPKKGVFYQRRYAISCPKVCFNMRKLVKPLRNVTSGNPSTTPLEPVKASQRNILPSHCFSCVSVCMCSRGTSQPTCVPLPPYAEPQWQLECSLTCTQQCCCVVKRSASEKTKASSACSA